MAKKSAKLKNMSEEELNARHAEKMRKKKAVRDKIIAAKTIEKGLTIVHTGKGKGKSTAAFGMVFRALGNDMKVGVVQFVKGKWGTGERVMLERISQKWVPTLEEKIRENKNLGHGSDSMTSGHSLEQAGNQVTMASMGEGFTWETQDRKRDIEAARKAWEKAKELILDNEHDMVLCDELNIVLRYDYLDVEEIIETLKAKPEMKHVIITGRNAKEELIEFADMVTEMTMIKHPFRSGVKAQVGIEF